MESLPKHREALIKAGGGFIKEKYMKLYFNCYSLMLIFVQMNPNTEKVYFTLKEIQNYLILDVFKEMQVSRIFLPAVYI